jgi:two-component system response regulator FixJ
VAGIDPTIVAVVDDDDAVRDSIQFLLEVAGHPVEVFASAAEFLRAEVGRFACLLLDQQMPHMTGLDLAARLRAGGAAIPIALMTGSATPAIRACAAGLEVDSILEKPLIAEGILAFVRAVRDR